ncbi:MAG TPA: hypothetical protein VFF39_15525 [Verrucomicrobiae bacterium]|nr:hypothetical protein [Verrucomicrobiae bacterium]
MFITRDDLRDEYSHKVENVPFRGRTTVPIFPDVSVGEAEESALGELIIPASVLQ